MFQGSSENHYTRLYSCKHFRNRVIRLQQLCAQHNLDAILLAIGMDTFHDEEMNKLQNWLLYGLSSSDIMGSALTDSFSDSFFVISRDGFQGYTNSSGFKELSNLTTLLSNCNLYTILRSDENDSDRQEVIKVAKFYEMIHDKKTVGVPVRKLTVSDYIGSEAQLLEKWPLIQAYGLDMVGGGFFTMKHQFVNVREDLMKIYAEYDAFAIFRIVYDEIDRFNGQYYDNFFKINNNTYQQRQERTEQDLIDSFWLRYEFSLLSRKISNIPAADDGLPLPRALVGVNSNKEFSELSNKEDKIYKYNQVNKDSALHFTVEYTEKNTNLRFARTYFLSNLSQHYMQGYSFSDEEEEMKVSDQGRVNELNSRFLFNAYLSLLSTFNTISNQLLKNELKLEDAQGQGYAVFSKHLATRIGKDDLSTFLPKGKESFSIHVKEYNTLGEEVPLSSTSQKLIMVRMQYSDLTSPFDGSELGSVLYAQTYFQIDRETFIEITCNVPNLQFWYTTNKHYEYLPLQIQTEKNLQSERLGERSNYFTDLIGILPVKEQLDEFFHDIILSGKWQFYEKGFIFVDHRLNSIVLAYEDIDSLIFYVGDQIWLEVKAKQNKSIPANILCGETFYLKVNQQIFNEKIKVFQTIQETSLPDLKVDKIYQNLPLLETSLGYRNFIVNQKYNKTLSSDYLNFSFQEPKYREILEFQVINEFNKMRGKDFIAFEPFQNVYSQGQQKPYQANITSQFIERLKTKTQDKVNLVLISGIPGSGKGKLADYLTKQLLNENVVAVTHKTTKVQDLIKFNTVKYQSSLLTFREQNSQVEVIVSALPSYHHLKKVIFELKKNEEFNSLFDIKSVITKVHARNFYMNKNRNIFQFLIENCMKGVTQAIVFEKSNVSQQEVDIMYRQLQNANFENNIVSTHGRTFSLADLASVLINSNEKFNIIYNKFFYGLEKEGKSAYYQEKQVQGAFVQYRYPIREDLITSTLMRALNVPIRGVEHLTPQTKKEEEEKENIKPQVELTREEKRKIEKEEKQRKKLEADLEPERLLKEEIDLTKRVVDSQDLYLERIRGYVLVEGKEEEQDYELVVNFNEVSLKPLKNHDKRIPHDQLGVIVYGRNLREELIRDVLKTCRTQLKQKKNLRTRDNVTLQEIEMLKEKHVSDMLPDGWFYNGYFYLDVNGKTSNEHPNLEYIIKHYIDEQNGEIGDHNREVQKEWRNDQKKYEAEVNIV